MESEGESYMCVIWQEIKGFDKSEIHDVFSIYLKFRDFLSYGE